MTQYCRYCSLASLQDDDLIYCEARKEIRDKKKIVSPNRCKPSCGVWHCVISGS